MFSFDDVIMVRMPQTPMRQPWRIWVNVSYESAKSDDITTKENKMKQTRVHILWDILNIITVFDSPCIYYGQSRKYNKTIKTTYEIVLWLFGAIPSCCYVISRTSTYTTGIVVLKKNSNIFCVRYSPPMIQGIYSLSGRTPYRKFSWSFEAARFGIRLFPSLWNLTGTSIGALPRCLSNFRAIQSVLQPISRLRDFARFGGKTSHYLLNRGPGAEKLFCTWVYIECFYWDPISTHCS